MKACRAVLIIDSNLSRDPYGARLEVEVIGIFPADHGDGGAEERRDPNDDEGATRENPAGNIRRDVLDKEI